LAAFVAASKAPERIDGGEGPSARMNVRDSIAVAIGCCTAADPSNIADARMTPAMGSCRADDDRRMSARLKSICA
jgi:hypothetical protein